MGKEWLGKFIHIFIYIYVCVCVCVCMYVYMYIFNQVLKNTRKIFFQQSIPFSLIS